MIFISFYYAKRTSVLTRGVFHTPPPCPLWTALATYLILSDLWHVRSNQGRCDVNGKPTIIHAFAIAQEQWMRFTDIAFLTLRDWCLSGPFAWIAVISATATGKLMKEYMPNNSCNKQSISSTTTVYKSIIAVSPKRMVLFHTPLPYMPTMHGSLVRLFLTLILSHSFNYPNPLIPFFQLLLLWYYATHRNYPQ